MTECFIVGSHVRTPWEPRLGHHRLARQNAKCQVPGSTLIGRTLGQVVAGPIFFGLRAKVASECW